VRILVDTPEALGRMVDDTLGEERVGLDVESDGLFAYRAGLCVVQLATARDVFVIDTLRLSGTASREAARQPLEPLVKLLGSDGPIKILHDLGFDARLLGEHGVPLGNCHDTAITATLLGRKATGLGTLLLSELGLTVDKSLQTHDWRTRPLEPAQLDYLAGDVEHLFALDDKLRGEASARGILPEVDEEIGYRLETAEQSVREPDLRPPFVRVKGVDKLLGGSGGGRRRDTELAIVRELAELREDEARGRNVPPYRVLGNETILALASTRPSSMLELSRMRGLGVEAGRLGGAILQAVARGKQAGKIPADEEHWFERPRVPADEARAERGRQAKLTAWRKAEAASRGVDEQAVLPGHLLRAIAGALPVAPTVETLAAVRGMSPRRLAHYGEAIVQALVREQPVGGETTDTSQASEPGSAAGSGASDA
jgi:ribonuclease D